MVFALAKTESDLITESTYLHFKELEDSISQDNGAIDNYREILSDQLNILHTSICSKLNDIMKFLLYFLWFLFP
jgi:magnesium transporter